jgi:hypothetical protein
MRVMAGNRTRNLRAVMAILMQESNPQPSSRDGDFDAGIEPATFEP